MYVNVCTVYIFLCYVYVYFVCSVNEGWFCVCYLTMSPTVVCHVNVL